MEPTAWIFSIQFSQTDTMDYGCSPFFSISGFVLVPCSRLSWFILAFDCTLISHSYFLTYLQTIKNMPLTLQSCILMTGNHFTQPSKSYKLTLQCFLMLFLTRTLPKEEYGSHLMHWFLGLTWFHTPNLLTIGSDVFAQHSDTQTHRPRCVPHLQQQAASVHLMQGMWAVIFQTFYNSPRVFFHALYLCCLCSCLFLCIARVW